MTWLDWTATGTDFVDFGWEATNEILGTQNYCYQLISSGLAISSEVGAKFLTFDVANPWTSLLDWGMQTLRLSEALIKCVDEQKVKEQGTDRAFGKLNLGFFVVDNLLQFLFGGYETLLSFFTLSAGY